MYLSETSCSSVQPVLEKTQISLVGFLPWLSLDQHHLKGSKPVARPQQIYLPQSYFDLQYSSTLYLPNLLTLSSLQYLLCQICSI